MAFSHQDRIALALRQVEELLAECSPCVQLRLGAMKRTEAVERSEELGRFPWGVLTFREDKRTRQSYTDPAQTPL